MKLGADPEWFLTNGKKPVSAIGLIGGTKRNPSQVPGLPPGFCLQEDNVTVEYNIPPATSQSQWVDYHLMIQDAIKTKVAALGLTPLIQGSVVMPDEELATEEAWVFGCDPDFNAWALKPNPRPRSENMNLRAAGGHIHVAFSGNKIDKIELVRILDLYVGLPLMLIDPDATRMELYGKAGSFRFKNYGLEYRTPSNIWTKNEELLSWVWTAIKNATWAFQAGYRADKEIQALLNTRNKIDARTKLEYLGITTC